jgi:hypothetical protein
MVTPAVTGSISREATTQTGNIFREATRGSMTLRLSHSSRLPASLRCARAMSASVVRCFESSDLLMPRRRCRGAGRAISPALCQ